MNWDEFIEQVAGLISHRETYQRTLGKIANSISENFGADKLDDFSRDLSERHGLVVSSSTLRNYRWVYVKTADLGLPEDLSYRTLQYIASSGKPKYWADKIEKEGLSSAEVYRLLKQEKGEPKKRKKICPSCGAEVEI